jgi:glycosyltransferase involved in cell wall biosynthesis
LNPRFSVVIPAYNAQATLGQQLTALEGQTYQPPFEVIVADNGSVDATVEVARSFEGRLPGLRVIDAGERRGAAAARNAGARVASGEYLVFCDADDEVDPGWLDGFDRGVPDYEFMTGSIDHDRLNPTSGESHWRSHVSSLPLALRFKPYALSGNMAVTRTVFEESGGFPEDMDSVGEDVAFSWALQLAGHDLHFQPEAVVAYRHKHDMRPLWRQHVAFGIADVVLYKRFRSHGVPPSRPTSVLAAYARLLRKVPYLFSAKRRPAAVRGWAKRWGRLRGSIRERVLYL